MSKYKVLGVGEDRAFTLLGEVDAPDGEDAIRMALGSGRQPPFAKFVTVPARYWAEHDVVQEQPAPVLVVNGRRPSVRRPRTAKLGAPKGAGNP